MLTSSLPGLGGRALTNWANRPKNLIYFYVNLVITRPGRARSNELPVRLGRKLYAHIYPTVEHSLSHWKQIIMELKRWQDLEESFDLAA